MIDWEYIFPKQKLSELIDDVLSCIHHNVLSQRLSTAILKGILSPKPHFFHRNRPEQHGSRLWTCSLGSSFLLTQCLVLTYNHTHEHRQGKCVYKPTNMLVCNRKCKCEVVVNIPSVAFGTAMSRHTCNETITSKSMVHRTWCSYTIHEQCSFDCTCTYNIIQLC